MDWGTQWRKREGGSSSLSQGSAGLSWEEGNRGWSPLGLSWVPGWKRSCAPIFATPEPRPTSRLRIKGFGEGSGVTAVPLHGLVLGQETRDLERGAYLPSLTLDYHCREAGCPPRSLPPPVAVPHAPPRLCTPWPRGLTGVVCMGALRGPGASGGFPGTALTSQAQTEPRARLHLRLGL